MNEFVNEAITGQRLLVKAHFNILAWTEDKVELQDLRNTVASTITQLGASLHLETVGAPQIWCAGIPGKATDLPINETFDSFAEQAVCFLTPETIYRFSLSSFGVRLGDRIHGVLIHGNLSDNPLWTGMITNRNKFVLGGSGSGNSYKGLCEFRERTYFTYTEKAISDSPSSGSRKKRF